MLKRTSVALVAALAAASMAAPAQAQGFPLTDENGDPVALGPTILYAAPFAIEAVRNVCSSELSADGFLATDGEALQARYATAAEGKWPEAKALLLQAGMSRGGGSGAEMLAAMPDEALKPFIDAMIPTLVASEIKPETCGDVEAVVEQLAPLPPENMANLFDVIIGIVERDRTAKKAAQ